MVNDFDKNLKNKIDSISKDYDLFICDFLFPALNCWDVKIPKLLFEHNVEFMIFKRNFENAKGIKKMLWWLQYIKAKKIENKVCNFFDFVMDVSQTDVDIHKKEFNVKDENIDYVNLGVDVTEYDSGDIKREDKSLTFTGGMDWTPNEEGIKWFHEKIWNSLNGFKTYVVGKNPSESVKELDAEDFIITGRVPEIEPYLFKGSIYIVPLLSGSGTRIKIFEAMAAKIPIISTTLGAEGLPVKDGENILLRDTPEDFKDAIIELNEDAELRNKIADNAFNLVKDNYSWDKVYVKFIEICDKLIK